jgi:hypothetical protein
VDLPRESLVDGIQSVEVSSLKWDESIYPRSDVDTDLVETYVEALNNGTTLPPIIVEEGTGRILDGVHRWRAHQKAGRTEIRATFVTVPEGETPKYYSARLNASHGARMKLSELKAIAMSMAEAFPDAEVAGMQTKIARDFSVAPRTVCDWIGSIYNAKRWGRDLAIAKLSILGWSQSMIAEKYGLDQTTVGAIVGKTATVLKSLESLLSRNDVAEAARKGEVPELLAWSIALDGKTDVERMEALGFNVRPYDVWNFQCDDRFGTDGYPGRIPAALVAHALFFYTEPGDLVLDPMAGGATVSDVCLAMGRRCLSYDIAPTEGRPEIIQADVAKGLPPKPKGRGAKLAFWDPPYFSKKDYAEGSISHLPKDQYLGVFARVAETATSWLEKDGRLALLMSDFTPSFDGKTTDTIWLWDYVRVIEQAGYQVERRIQCPLGSQQLSPRAQAAFPTQKKLGRLGRDLVVFRRA